MARIAIATGKPPVYTLDITDTIREFNGGPHRVIKMLITGEGLHVTSTPAFTRIIHRGRVEESFSVTNVDDEHQLISLFPVDIDFAGYIEFGYGNTIIATFKEPDWQKVDRLDPGKIDRNVVTITRSWIQREIAKPK